MNIKELMLKQDKKLEDYYSYIFNEYNFRRKRLTSLKYLPNIKCEIDLQYNNIVNLEGLPKDFDVEINLNHNKLTSLKGLPKNFNSKIWLLNNEIKTLEGLNDVLLPENIIGLNKNFIIREYIRLGKCHLLI